VWEGLGRNILLFPNGTDGKGKALSIFLNVPGYEKLPVGWSRKHHFTLTLIDQRDSAYSLVKGDSNYAFPVLGLGVKGGLCTLAGT
jgi:hypothetical protein